MAFSGEERVIVVTKLPGPLSHLAYCIAVDEYR